MPRIIVPDHVENADAYIRAAEARIANNRAKGNRKRWNAESGEEVVTRCCNFLGETGEFAPTVELDEDGYVIRQTPHPLCKASYGDFFLKMNHAIADWGRLSPAQEKAVLAMIEKAKERVAAREAAKEAKAASAQHIGTVGERRDFDLTFKFRTEFDGIYGTTFVYVLEDDAGNVIVYKGSSRLWNAERNHPEKGERIKFKATIKAHGERDGIKQTIVSRPKQ